MAAAVVSPAPLFELSSGFPLDASPALWRSIADRFVRKSVASVSKWRANHCLHSMSPHIAGWWATEARQHIVQSKEYVTPVFSDNEGSCADEEGGEDWGEDELDDGVAESLRGHQLSAPSFSEPPGIVNGLRCDSERWDESVFSGAGQKGEDDWDLCAKSNDEEARSWEQTSALGAPSISGRKGKRELKVLDQQDFTSSIAVR